MEFGGGFESFFFYFLVTNLQQKLVKTSGENVQGEMSEFGFVQINKENIY